MKFENFEHQLYRSFDIIKCLVYICKHECNLSDLEGKFPGRKNTLLRYIRNLEDTKHIIKIFPNSIKKITKKTEYTIYATEKLKNWVHININTIDMRIKSIKKTMEEKIEKKPETES